MGDVRASSVKTIMFVVGIVADLELDRSGVRPGRVLVDDGGDFGGGTAQISSLKYNSKRVASQKRIRASIGKKYVYDQLTSNVGNFEA